MKYIVFGIGYDVKRRYSDDFLDKISYFVDNDVSKVTKKFYGKEICSPSRLITEDKENVFIFISAVYEYRQIKNQLLQMGFDKKNFIWTPNWYGNNIIPSAYGYCCWEIREPNFDFKGLEKRVSTMAQLIGDDCNSIMDLGCGTMTLLKYLQSSIEYIPVDYIKSADNTVVCNFNKHEFPSIKTDYIFISGLLEYIFDIDWMINEVCKHCNYVILSYNPIEKVKDIGFRQNSGWVNHLSVTQLLIKFINNGFQPVDDRLFNGNDIIIKLARYN